ncbi:MAG: S-methyl-5-thioribose-1-phosphate isomerase [Deltaproteobacteria bacterium]|nr:S-methyl-5-thioribose-1-phosphate isomerase [Deltaproteobacteria bacterium]
MLVDGTPRRTIWTEGDVAQIIDQSALPHRFVTLPLRTLADAAHAIASMQVRGAPLIGVAAAYGLALGLREDPSDAAAARHKTALIATRPTAVNLRWAVDTAWARVRSFPPNERAAAAWRVAGAMADADVAACEKLAEHGFDALSRHARGKALNVLTHCNAGWLATIDWGTALAPVYLAAQRGMSVQVFVDETRPRNQGASLTAWELAHAGIPHTVIVDNAGGLLMQRGQIDACIVGTDRTTRGGDVCNKIGTYLKALAAKDNDVPFYVAVPTSSYDPATDRGEDVVIEERAEDEVHWMSGVDERGEVSRVRVTPLGAHAKNPGFDITRAALVTGYVTEVGVLGAADLEAHLAPLV